MKRRRWRLFPRAYYTNFRKEYPQMSPEAFRSWLSTRRYWGGRIIYISVRHHNICFDFRADVERDLRGEPW